MNVGREGTPPGSKLPTACASCALSLFSKSKILLSRAWSSNGKKSGSVSVGMVCCLHSPV